MFTKSNEPQILWRIGSGRYLATCWEANGLKSVDGWFDLDIADPAIRLESRDAILLGSYIPELKGSGIIDGYGPVNGKMRYQFRSQGPVERVAADAVPLTDEEVANLKNAIDSVRLFIS